MLPIQTALLSFGMSGRLFHAPFLHTHNGFSLYAVWERTKNEAAAVYPRIKTFRTLDALLADEAVELVVVNTPNYTHYDYARQALLAGKHVLVEKPFVVTTAEGEELIALASEKNLLLTVYHNRRYDSDYRTLQKIVAEDWLGEIVEAEFHFDRYRAELSPKGHKETAGPGTGALYDLGSHLIDQALQLFGWPRAVFADIRTIRPHSQVDDYFELLLYYPQLRVRLHCSYLVREPLPGYQLHGRRGSFIKHKTNVQEEALQRAELPGSNNWGTEPEAQWGRLHTEKEGGVIDTTVTSEVGNYAEFFSGLAAAIREGAPLPVTATDALQVIRIIETAFESQRTGHIVSLS